MVRRFSQLVFFLLLVLTGPLNALLISSCIYILWADPRHQMTAWKVLMRMFLFFYCISKNEVLYPLSNATLSNTLYYCPCALKTIKDSWWIQANRTRHHQLHQQSMHSFYIWLRFNSRLFALWILDLYVGFRSLWGLFTGR